MPHQYDTVVDVEAPAADVERAIGRWSTVESLGDTRCRVRMTTDDLEWPVLALAQLDADFVVVGPPEFAVRIRDLAHRFAHASADA
jgi:predicted DNA-binding transcriptional regulator YafY